MKDEPNTHTAPKDIPQPHNNSNTNTNNNNAQRRGSFFGWAFGGFSPTQTSAPTFNGNPNEYKASGGSPPSPSSSTGPRRKPRTMSQGVISHDEALNLSRAGGFTAPKYRSGSVGSASAMATTAPASANVNATANANGQQYSFRPSPPGDKNQQGPSGTATAPQQPKIRRQRRNSQYEGIGLVAAFSGGPSSF